MTATELVSKLEALNVELVVAGDRLRYRPRAAVSEDLLTELRARKAEVMDLLSSQAGPRVEEALPGGLAQPRVVLAAEVVAMGLEEFAGARRLVTVHSKVLDEEVIFASDNAVIDPGERRVVYRAQELRELLDLRPEDLRFVHRVKKVFGGSVVPS